MTEQQRPICSEVRAKLIFRAGGFAVDMEFHRPPGDEIKRGV
jgi:hypothetical protein